MATERERIDSADQRISEYLSLSPAEQTARWTSPEFLGVYPLLIARALSAEGLQKYSHQTRTQLYDSAISAMETLPHDIQTSDYTYVFRGETYTDQQADPTIPYIPAYKMSYDVTTETPLSSSPANNLNRENLFRLILAATIALGASIDSGDFAQIRRILTATPRIDKKDQEYTISLLSPQDSKAREWIKKHHLDTIANQNWDTLIAKLLLSSPRYTLPQQSGSISLPSELAATDPSMYAPEFWEVFVDYAADLADTTTLNNEFRNDKKVATKLVEFFGTIRQIPQLMQKPHVRAALSIILYKANMLPENLQGQIPQAKEILSKYSEKAKYPWIKRPGKDLLS